MKILPARYNLSLYVLQARMRQISHDKWSILGDTIEYQALLDCFPDSVLSQNLTQADVRAYMMLFQKAETMVLRNEGELPGNWIIPSHLR